MTTFYTLEDIKIKGKKKKSKKMSDRGCSGIGSKKIN
jgi:hypothetical protein